MALAVNSIFSVIKFKKLHIIIIYNNGFITFCHKDYLYCIVCEV